jgi:hypothetical protein
MIPSPKMTVRRITNQRGAPESNIHPVTSAEKAKPRAKQTTNNSKITNTEIISLSP